MASADSVSSPGPGKVSPEPPAAWFWRRKPWPPKRKVFSMSSPKLVTSEPLRSAVISRLRSSVTVRFPSGVEPVKLSTPQPYGRKYTSSSDVKSMPNVPSRRNASVGVKPMFELPAKCEEFTKFCWYMFSRVVANAGFP